ncbi:MAG TPA: rRNA maturation RNase YbeY [Porphyromonadaceae bacterium]|nr:rRNA maturation RNase YbeY [Porphyromonadaceae bacterium]
MIQFYHEEVKKPSFNQQKVKSYIKLLASEYGKKIGEIGYNFCTDDRILSVNKEFLQHDYYTDIITFDYSENRVLNGDIFVSIDTVRSNSEKFNTPFEEELHRVIFHGILHLCGINDKTEEESTKMRECENKALIEYSNFLKEQS